ncbi:MAG TPA: TetR/AcrR family transcriptional regulator, partial [Cytophagaceae bacterium]
MTTKEKILNTALLLFNKEGIEDITVRDIAKAMGISHGNLCYHYPNKEVIIETLYQQLVDELNKELDKVQRDVISIELIYNVLITT